MSESFAQRLARLRRDGPVGSSPAIPPKERRSLGLSAQQRERLGRQNEAQPQGHTKTLGPPARLEPFAPEVAIRTDRRTLDAVHGTLTFGQTLTVCSGVLARLGLDPALERLDLSRAVYLDIETTGLAGGAGTYSFLVALGSFESDSFCVRQLFLESPAGEPALLAEVARMVRASSGLVTFFGKSFDRHRLEDKMRQHGVPPPFAELPHLDLYHPCRRLYGKSFGDGRLQTLERHLLGFERENDLSGAFAPAAWFDHLAGRPHLLEAVFHHNLLDVFSLAGLAAHVGDAERERDGAGRPLPGPPLRRAIGLAAVAARRRDREDQARWLQLALERCMGEEDEPTRRKTSFELGVVKRQLNDSAAALAIWEQLASGSDRLAALARFEQGKWLARRAETRAAGVAALRDARGRVLHVLSEPERSRVISDLDRRLQRFAGDPA